MSKAAKRQRQKDQRRQKIEEEMRSYRAKRRRRMTINLAVVGVVLAGVMGLVSLQREQKDSPKEDASKRCTSHSTGAEGTAALKAPSLDIDKSKTYKASIETSEGTVVVELADDTSPCTVNSFIFLARQGFYDGLTFHRVVPGFAVQGGDPKGDGSGGPGYQVVEAPPADTKYSKGIVAMAKTQADPPGASGSQFFIVPGDGAASLNGTQAQPAQYALLGKVTSGFDVLTKIEQIPRGEGPDAEKPSSPIRIIKVTITES